MTKIFIIFSAKELLSCYGFKWLVHKVNTYVQDKNFRLLVNSFLHDCTKK